MSPILAQLYGIPGIYALQTATLKNGVTAWRIVDPRTGAVIAFGEESSQEAAMLAAAAKLDWLEAWPGN
jgi:hypothetical protein